MSLILIRTMADNRQLHYLLSHYLKMSCYIRAAKCTLYDAHQGARSCKVTEASRVCAFNDLTSNNFIAADNIVEYEEDQSRSINSASEIDS